MDFSIKKKNLDAEESKLGTWNSGVSQERNSANQNTDAELTRSQVWAVS